MKRPEEKKDETASQHEEAEEKPEDKEPEKDDRPDEEKYPEIELEDKVHCVNPMGADYKVWVHHQAASRLLRKEIASYMHKQLSELERGSDKDDWITKMEQTAVDTENAFFKLLTEKQDVPVFSWEIN